MSKTYSLVWCHSSYRARRDGFLVHAADDDTGKALCGVKWSDSGWGEVGRDGEPGCMRCRAALRKLGVIK